MESDRILLRVPVELSEKQSTDFLLFLGEVHSPIRSAHRLSLVKQSVNCQRN